MIETRGFTGKLNSDDNPYRLPSGDFSDALNITRDAQDAGQDVVASNIVGNQLIEDTLDGTNKVIGNYADKVRNRQYYFTWDIDGYNRISYYDGNTNSIIVVMEDLTNTDGIPVLKFDPSFRINHIDIIYRDEEGDLLYWTDGLNPPRKINVKTALNGDYGVILSSYLDVAKEPPSSPPYCVYENALLTDTFISAVNNVVNKQFKFKYRFVFDDLEKSVTSAQSEIPIPYNYTSQASISNPYNNAYIRLLIQTGNKNVTRIEILGCESIGASFGDFYLIEVLDKSKLSIDDNDVISYLFYNNKVYNTIPLTESLQPFDNVPQIAYTQSLPNGNVLDYGAITEGYDLVEIDNALRSLSPEPLTFLQDQIYPVDKIYEFLLISAYQQEQPAYGQGNIKIIVAGIPLVGDSFSIYISSDPFDFTIQDNISVTVGLGDTLNIIANNISTAAIALGYTSISVIDNEVIIYKDGYSLIGVTQIAATALPTINSAFAYDWGSKYQFGVVYFDDKGRTNGVNQLKESIATTTFWYSEGAFNPDIVKVPTFSIGINSKPPNWAYYYQLVRSENLTKSNFLYWISDATYKSIQYDVEGYQYAYISITNLFLYINNNPQFSSVLGYEFTIGDRIKFVTRVINGVADTIGYKSDNDFAILALETNPKINGITKTGSFIKILLPSNLDTNFDFGDNQQYSNYFIELYTPNKNFSNDLTIFYEFGEKYTIGNPGTNNAYHQGKQFINIPLGAFNQGTYTYNVPPDPPFTFDTTAQFLLNKGDSYYRNRYIQSGGFATFTMKPVLGLTGSAYPMLADLGANTIPSLYWKAQSVDGSTTTNPIVTLGQNNANSFPNSYNYFFNGVITIRNPNFVSTVGPIYIDFSYDSFFHVDVTIPLGTLGASETKTIQLNNIPSTTSSTYSVYGWRVRNAGVNAIDITEFTLTVTDSNSCKIGIIDKNFSDDYVSLASPNGRPWKFDPNAGRAFNPTLIRFGGELYANTTVNDINRFYDENYDQYDRSRGTIKKMFIEGRNQFIFQEFDVGVVTILTQIVRDTAGNPLSAESEKLLNKIVYPYIGQYGIGNVPESFAYGKNAKYFVDSNKGVVCRLSTDGITPISILYKMNNFFVNKIAGFKDTLNTTIPIDGTPTIYGAFDAYTNKYILALSAIDRDDLVQPAYTLAFLESRASTEGFECFLSFHPENMGALNNLFFSFKEGKVWTHNSDTYNNFFGVQYPSYVDIVFNDAPLDKKTFLSIMETANTIWYCDSIKSQLNSYGSTPQQTRMVEARFSLLEGQYYASIPRDINSPGGLVNGDTMHGNYIIVKFKKDNANQFYYINTVSLNYTNSPSNIR